MHKEKLAQWPHVSQWLFFATVGVIFGVTYASWVGIGNDIMIFVSALAGLAVILLGRQHTYSILIPVLLIAYVFGIWHTEKALIFYQSYARAGEEVHDTARVILPPQNSSWYRSAPALISDKTRILIRFPKHADIVMGDIVNVSCTLKQPKVYNDFDYPMYLAAKKISYICEKPIYEVTGRSRGFLATIATLRRTMESHITQNIRAPESALANGLIFGGDERLSEDLQKSFAATGMSHIVAVSGYNVSVIVLAVTAIVIFVGAWRKHAIIFAIFAVFVFVAMIGFPASGVRAAVMGTLVLVAVLYGRAAHAFGAILIAGASMLFYNPLQFRWDVGFQLSFLAVIGIIFFYPIFERVLIKQRKAFGLLEMIFLTVSAQLFVLPIIMYHFEVFSASSLITNILVLPILPITMLATFLTAILPFIWAPLALPSAWLAQALLSYEVYVITFFAGQSWSTITITTFSLLLASLYYIGLSVIAYYFYRRYTYPYA